MKFDVQHRKTLEALREIYEKHPHPFRGAAGGGNVHPKVRLGIGYTPTRFERRTDGHYQCLNPRDGAFMERLQVGLLRRA